MGFFGHDILKSIPFLLSDFTHYRNKLVKARQRFLKVEGNPNRRNLLQIFGESRI